MPNSEKYSFGQVVKWATFYSAALLCVPGCTGTEGGNPFQGKVHLGVYTTHPEAVSVGSNGGKIQVSHLWMNIDHVTVLGCEEQPRRTDIAGATVDLLNDGFRGQLGRGTYCGIEIHPSLAAEPLPEEIAPSLVGHSVYLEATRSDGVGVRVYSHASDVWLYQTSEPLSVDALYTLLVADFDLAQWFANIDIAAQVPDINNTVVISADSHSDLLQGLEENIGTSLTMRVTSTPEAQVKLAISQQPPTTQLWAQTPYVYEVKLTNEGTVGFFDLDVVWSISGPTTAAWSVTIEGEPCAPEGARWHCRLAQFAAKNVITSGVAWDAKVGKVSIAVDEVKAGGAALVSSKAQWPSRDVWDPQGQWIALPKFQSETAFSTINGDQAFIHRGFLYSIGTFLPDSAKNGSIQIGAMDGNGLISSWQQDRHNPLMQSEYSVVFSGNILLISGGIQRDQPNNPILQKFVEAYPINANGTVSGQRTVVSDIPIPFSAHQSVVVNNRLYLLGGRNTIANPFSNIVYSVDMDDMLVDSVNESGSVDTWRAEQSLPVPVRSHRAFAYGNRIYVIGGENDSGVLSSVFVSQIGAGGVLGNWQTTTPLPIALTDHSVILENSRVVVLGGATFALVPSDKMYVANIDQATGTLGAWREDGVLPTALFGFGATGRTVNGHTDRYVTVGDTVYVLHRKP